LPVSIPDIVTGELEFHVFLLKMYAPQMILAVSYQTPTKLIYVCDRYFGSLLSTCPHKIRIMFFDFHVRHWGTWQVCLCFTKQIVSVLQLM